MMVEGTFGADSELRATALAADTFMRLLADELASLERVGTQEHAGSKRAGRFAVEAKPAIFLIDRFVG